MPLSIPTRRAPEPAFHDGASFGRLKYILIVSSIRQDRAQLRHILRPEYRTIAAGDCRDALQRLARARVSVVLCDCTLTDGNWLDILKRASRLTDPPLLIVASPLTDSRLGAEVVNLGGYDLLAKPFDAKEVRHVVETAWMHKTSNRVRQCR